MIDFWIFPLSTIWGAYQIQGFAGFFLYYFSSTTWKMKNFR